MQRSLLNVKVLEGEGVFSVDRVSGGIVEDDIRSVVWLQIWAPQFTPLTPIFLDFRFYYLIEHFFEFRFDHLKVSPTHLTHPSLRTFLNCQHHHLKMTTWNTISPRCWLIAMWWHHFATFDDIILNDLHILDFESTGKKFISEAVHNFSQI